MHSNELENCWRMNLSRCFQKYLWTIISVWWTGSFDWWEDYFVPYGFADSYISGSSTIWTPLQYMRHWIDQTGNCRCILSSLMAVLSYGPSFMQQKWMQMRILGKSTYIPLLLEQSSLLRLASESGLSWVSVMYQWWIDKLLWLMLMGAGESCPEKMTIWRNVGTWTAELELLACWWAREHEKKQKELFLMRKMENVDSAYIQWVLFHVELLIYAVEG